MPRWAGAGHEKQVHRCLTQGSGQCWASLSNLHLSPPCSKVFFFFGGGAREEKVRVIGEKMVRLEKLFEGMERKT